MNKLRRDIEKGEVVVTEDSKLWEVCGGFGMKNENMGSALYAYELDENGHKIPERDREGNALTWNDGRPRYVSEDIRYVICPQQTEAIRTILNKSKEFEVSLKAISARDQLKDLGA
jgi:hypothetical protein